MYVSRYMVTTEAGQGDFITNSEEALSMYNIDIRMRNGYT